MKNPVRKVLLGVIALLVGAYGYVAYDHYQFLQNIDDLNEAQHRLSITTQKMENWKICVDGQPAESQYMCDALIGYPQDLIRDFQSDRDLINASMEKIGEYAE